MKECCNRTDQILSESARRWPARWAVSAQDGRVSYAQLDGAADRVSQALRAVGISQGSIIGISLDEGRLFLAALFGILRSQCVAIPIAPNLLAAERDRLIVEAGVIAVVGDARSCSRASSIVVDDPYDLGALLTLEPCEPSRSRLALFPDAAIIRYTSGTTGLSKGVVLSHQAVLERVEVSKRLLDVREDDAVMVALSLSYHFIASAMACISAGANILDCAGLSSAEMVDLGVAHGASILYAAPSQYELLCQTKSESALSSLRRAISTSALISCSTAKDFQARFKKCVTQVYGIIEVGLPLWNEAEIIEPFALGVCKAPYECKVVNDRGESVTEYEIGELAVRGPGLFSGYLIGDADSERRQSGEWVFTGDLVSRDSTGGILYRGRKKSVINVGQHTIFPEEVEEVLRQAPEVQMVRISSEQHESLGSMLIAEVVLTPHAKESIEAWRALCRDELSGYKVPTEFRIVESLPSTGSGKIVRRSVTRDGRM